MWAGREIKKDEGREGDSQNPERSATLTAKWKKIVVAGPLVMETVYPRINSGDAPKVRGAKRKLSSAAQQRMNQIYSYQKLEFMLAANFVKGDLVCTFTYDDAHLPLTRKEAEGKLKYFRSKLSACRKKMKKQLVMFWNTEHRHGDGRWHHHCVINSTGEDFELIQKLWGQGRIEFRRLRVDKDKNYETQARYMCKEEKEKLGQRSWSYTRNVAKPECETFRVPDDTPLQAPKGTLVMQEASERNDYGSYKFVKYVYINSRSAVRSKARRRKSPQRS